ncbi:EutN/CcmL family microcompartment protein [Mucisphaera sp.]|uniref:EutN/CcmL family microcompartment protein n=1 Tax=Mucisphaera sp. TaxID=2913024 RepID=UPI003D0B0C1F
MFLGRVQGQIVSTVKDPALKGARLAIVEPLKVNYDNDKLAANAASANGRFEVTGRAIVAIDHLGAATGQTVLVTQGSSARMAEGCDKMPTDAVIVGVIDRASIAGTDIEVSAPTKPATKARR